MRTLIYLKQKENERLQDYTRQVKIANDVFVLHIGGPSPIEFTKYMEGMTGYNASDPISIDKCRKKAYQQLLVFLSINNSEKI